MNYHREKFYAFYCNQYIFEVKNGKRIMYHYVIKYMKCNSNFANKNF